MAIELSLGLDFRNKRFKDAAVGLRAYAKALQVDWDSLAPVLSKELRSFLDSVAEALAKRHGVAWPSGTSGQSLSKRSGGLVDSIIKSVTVEGTTFETIEGHIGAAFPYGIHEFGGVITPKSAKYLTIPLPAALDNRGVPLRKSAREWEHTFVATSKAGNLIIFQRRGAAIVPLYVLKSSVPIRPRLGMGKTLDAGLPYFREHAMDQMVQKLIEGSR